MEEVWKNIPRYEGYQASNLGRIRTYNKTTYTKRHGIRHWGNRVLKYKSNSTKTGYRVDLWKNGKPHTLLVARLVATTFLEDLIETNMTANHKNGNRLDNRVENLEWLSRSENIKYGFENGQYKQHETVLFNDTEYHKFRSKSLAGAFLNRNHSYISNCIKNNRKIYSKDGIEYKVKITQN